MVLLSLSKATEPKGCVCIWAGIYFKELAHMLVEVLGNPKSDGGR